MIARDPKQRTLYEARLKAERDALAKEDYAREEGREEERLVERFRTVKMLRDIVGDAAPTDDELTGLSLDDLAGIEAKLQRRLRDRG